MKFHAMTVAVVSASVQLAAAYSGDMTHYDPAGTGSCGVSSSGSDDIVALSQGMMAKHPCFSKISIYNPATGTTNWGTVVDTCTGCKEQDFDVSNSLFYKVAPTGDGRVSGIEWGGSKVGGKRDVEEGVVERRWVA